MTTTRTSDSQDSAGGHRRRPTMPRTYLAGSATLPAAPGGASCTERTGDHTTARNASIRAWVTLARTAVASSGVAAPSRSTCSQPGALTVTVRPTAAGAPDPAPALATARRQGRARGGVSSLIVHVTSLTGARPEGVSTVR